MTTINAADQDYTNNADGFTLGGGTTKRKITVTDGDITLTGGNSNDYVFPASDDTLVGRDSTDTLTNKTIDGNDNTITNLDTDTLADSAITPAKLLSGTGTDWNMQSWTPTMTGYSSAPTGGTYSYIQIGKMVFLQLREPTDGTANNATITYSLPVASAANNNAWSTALVKNNGSNAAGALQVSTSATTLTVFATGAAGGFTTSASARVINGSIVYCAA